MSLSLFVVNMGSGEHWKGEGGVLQGSSSYNAHVNVITSHTYPTPSSTTCPDTHFPVSYN